MKTKRALLPVLTGALLLALGLAGCGAKPADGSKEGGQSNIPDTSDVEEEVKINVTAEGDKKELQVGETVRLHADQEGVEWGTRSPEIVSVSATGLVTAVAPGSARVTAKKDGFATGSITITVVKAPEKPADYYLGLEQAEHIAGREEGWGAYFYGQWFSGPFDTPVENNNGATEDGTSIGNLYTGCKEILTFTSNKAVKVGLGLTMAYAQQVDLASNLSVKFNNVAVDLTGKVCEGPEDGSTSNYYDFHTVMLGDVDLVVGNNVFEVELIGSSGVNMDNILIYTTEKLELAVVPAAVKPKIEVVEDSLTVEVEGKVQIQVKNDLAGVEFTSADTTIATVSSTGEVTGVKAGRTTIDLTKEGYKKATVNITVKAKPIAGQIVIEAEDGQLSEGARVETNNADASGTGHVGYLAAGTSLTLSYTAENAGTYKLSFRGASNNVTDWSGYPNVNADALELASCMTLKVNSTNISMEGKVIPAGKWGTWVEVDLGTVSIVAGANTFLFEFSAQGPNIDCVLLTPQA